MVVARSFLSAAGLSLFFSRVRSGRAKFVRETEQGGKANRRLSRIS